MKTIVLIRHAKSSWDEDVSDLNRPLSTRGLTDANLLSKAFKSNGFRPDRVYSSPAKRAASTCTIFMENLELPNNLLVVDQQLYDFGGEKVLRLIKSLDDDLKKIMIFGHNHALTSLTNSLGDAYIDNLPTSGLVMIDFNVDGWEELKQGRTKMIITPKDFK